MKSSEGFSIIVMAFSLILLYVGGTHGLIAPDGTDMSGLSQIFGAFGLFVSSFWLGQENPEVE